MALRVLRLDRHGVRTRPGEINAVVIINNPAGVVVDRITFVQAEIVGIRRRSALRGRIITVGLAGLAFRVLARRRRGQGLGCLDHRLGAFHPVRLVALRILHFDRHGVRTRFGKVDTVVVRRNPAGVVVDNAALVQAEVVGIRRRSALRGRIIAVGLTGFTLRILAHRRCGQGLGCLDNRLGAFHPVRLVALRILHFDGHGIRARFGEIDTVVVRGNPARIVINRISFVQAEVVGIRRGAALRGGVITVRLTHLTVGVLGSDGAQTQHPAHGFKRLTFLDDPLMRIGSRFYGQQHLSIERTLPNGCYAGRNMNTGQSAALKGGAVDAACPLGNDDAAQCLAVFKRRVADVMRGGLYFHFRQCAAILECAVFNGGDPGRNANGSQGAAPFKGTPADDLHTGGNVNVFQRGAAAECIFADMGNAAWDRNFCQRCAAGKGVCLHARHAGWNMKTLETGTAGKRIRANECETGRHVDLFQCGAVHEYIVSNPRQAGGKGDAGQACAAGKHGKPDLCHFFGNADRRQGAAV